jgi:hypothetical protein
MSTTASEKEKEFLNDFSTNFNDYINAELKEYYKK